TDRMSLPVIEATPSWYAGRANTDESPAPSENCANGAGSCHTGSGPSLSPFWGLTSGTLPPTAVTHGESSQAAVDGVLPASSHWAFASARFCTTPQSPVPSTKGIPALAAASSPGFCASS